MRGKRKTKLKELKVVFKQAECVSEEEIQQKWDNVFDILLDEVAKRKNSELRCGVRKS
ncbi:MAG: hypothetical protein ABSB00_00115 [Minisyncoccia bacterium]|jgi:hypothetical protein